MMTSRTAQQCGQADYGWLQARYTFSFGHYFDPKLLGYASLRVLNQEVLAPGAAFQPRTYPRVDILNLILRGEAEYRDSEGNYCRAGDGDAVLLSTQPGVAWSELNVAQGAPLTRLQLWLDACPERENALVQQQAIDLSQRHQLIASPDGEQGSLQVRQQVWIHHIMLEPGDEWQQPLRGSRAWLQSIHGKFQALSANGERESLGCGDGAFIRDESSVRIQAQTPLRALAIDLMS